MIVSIPIVQRNDNCSMFNFSGAAEHASGANCTCSKHNMQAHSSAGIDKNIH